MADFSEEQRTPRRRGPGRQWQPGESGNPGGRPKVAGEIRDACRAVGQRVVEGLIDLALGSPKHEVRVAASRELLDRGYGRSPQAVTGEDGGPLRLLVEQSTNGLLERLERLAGDGVGDASGSGSRRVPELTPGPTSDSSLPPAPVSTTSPGEERDA